MNPINDSPSFTGFESALSMASEGKVIPAPQRLALFICRDVDRDLFGDQKPTLAEIATLYDTLNSVFHKMVVENNKTKPTTLDSLFVCWHVEYGRTGKLATIMEQWVKKIQNARQVEQKPPLSTSWKLGINCTYKVNNGCAMYQDDVIEHDGTLCPENPWEIYKRTKNPADKVRAKSLEPSGPRGILWSDRQNTTYSFARDAVHLCNDGKWDRVRSLIYNRNEPISPQLGCELLSLAIDKNQRALFKDLMDAEVPLSEEVVFLAMIRCWHPLDCIDMIEKVKPGADLLTNVAVTLGERYTDKELTQYELLLLDTLCRTQGCSIQFLKDVYVSAKAQNCSAPNRKQLECRLWAIARSSPHRDEIFKIISPPPPYNGNADGLRAAFQGQISAEDLYIVDSYYAADIKNAFGKGLSVEDLCQLLALHNTPTYIAEYIRATQNRLSVDALIQLLNAVGSNGYYAKELIRFLPVELVEFLCKSQPKSLSFVNSMLTTCLEAAQSDEHKEQIQSTLVAIISQAAVEFAELSTYLRDDCKEFITQVPSHVAKELVSQVGLVVIPMSKKLTPAFITDNLPTVLRLASATDPLLAAEVFQKGCTVDEAIAYANIVSINPLRKTFEDTIKDYDIRYKLEVYKGVGSIEQNQLETCIKLLPIWSFHMTNLNLLFTSIEKGYSLQRAACVAELQADYDIDLNLPDDHEAMVETVIGGAIAGLAEHQWSLSDLMAYLSYQSYQMEAKLGHNPSAKYGATRILDTSYLHVSNIKHASMGGAQTQAKFRSFIENPPQNAKVVNYSELCLLASLPAQNKWENNFKAVQIRGTLNDKVIPLSTFVWANKRATVCEYEGVFGIEDDALRIIHTKKQYLILNSIFQQYKDLLDRTKEQDVFSNIAHLHWWVTHAMPFSEGAENIGTLLVKMLLKFWELRYSGWQNGVLPEIEAYLSATPEEYKEKFIRFIV